MATKRWANIGNRSYERTTERSQAFVFGAYRPTSLWAWVVYWRGGSISGVANGFRDAKKKAEVQDLIRMGYKEPR